MKKSLFGNISPSEFLRDYWQKKPLLIRKAFSNFNGLLSKQELISLALRDDVQSRLVNFKEGEWELSHGPFKKRDFGPHLGDWTLLVQDLNHFLWSAEALLKDFNFIPHARLDDLMVSYAPDGGGVGPHFDSYDVFLLQGSGQRRWQIAKQRDKTLIPDSPLRILQNFKPEQEWVLEPGDMLYLPPNYAHNGIAIGECMTYSIGFRAPSNQELSQEFLIYLQDHYEISGMYSDPDLTLSKHPAEISSQMVEKVSHVINKMRFTKKEVEKFLGAYLTEPKSTIFFDSPEPLLSKKRFLQAAVKQGIVLDLKSQLLFIKNDFFMNGERCSVSKDVSLSLKKLANTRELDVSMHGIDELEDILYGWYADGFLLPKFSRLDNFS